MVSVFLTEKSMGFHSGTEVRGGEGRGRGRGGGNHKKIITDTKCMFFSPNPYRKDLNGTWSINIIFFNRKISINFIPVI